MKDINFRYPARPNVQIFAGFSLCVPNGTTAALVGQSGSGKSTVISLLERFYDPNAGEVLTDGVNLKNFQFRWIREQIGLVSQEPTLFTASIKDNIAYGKESATDEEIMTAITLANAKKFIDKLPQGINTMAGEHGTQLSVGQKQRIVIARAILKNPKILLLDEATSALDAESERVIQEALEKAMSNRTTVVVAHRLTTIKNADTISVVQQGKIVEKEGEKNEDEDSRIFEADLDRASFHKPSNLRSLSRGSSWSRRSHSNNIVAPLTSQSSVQERGDGDVETGEHSDKKCKNVSMKHLAYLNKPELPVLLLGGIERIRSLTIQKVMHQEISWFDHPENASGSIGARLSTDALTRQVKWQMMLLVASELLHRFVQNKGSILVQHGKATFSEVFKVPTIKGSRVKSKRVDRTNVVVAHRLSTIKGVDIIAVVKNGVIAEKGRHDK
ncbi:hypothetical protein Ahy_A04g020738 [Arachis hypogaea]|uniref:ABC transporter domain-containing protein n=1 Tax=Arachis hypogaea TaxID=3818 RepID=A0A445DID4_ARAHY|nr:hypothetical protein Ahy_A04g020738 [Arachis hypogaea]